MLLRQLINKGVEAVSAVYPEREAREMVFAFLEHQLGTKRYTHIVDPEYAVSEDNVSASMSAFRRMASGEPLQYVMGSAFFYGRSFFVSPSVLIPRPETEILCQNVVNGCKSGKGMRILDLCTGSGCIAWTLALEMPGAEIFGVDISDDALKVADSQDFSEEISAADARKPQFIKADVLARPLTLLGQFDVIVSNPPYVMDKEKAFMRTNVLDHEPHLALFVSDDDPLVFYRAVSRWAMALLKPGGFGIVEINEALGPETSAVFEADGYVDVQVIKDLSDRNRFVLFRSSCCH